MAEKDLSAKKLEDYNEVFADIYNTLLFRKQVLLPERLKSGPTESVYKTDSKRFHSQGRDILKRYHNQTNLMISSFGIENQAYHDKTMPIRIMRYDVGTYQQQIYDGEAQMTPVITIVLNMTENRWTAPKSLHEMLDIVPELSEYVQDYKIFVFDIAFLDDETIQSFTSDFGEIARFFKSKRLGKDPMDSTTILQHPQEILEFISIFTKDRRYLDYTKHLEKEEGGAVTMCEVLDAYIARGIEQGIPQGETRKLVSLVCRKLKKGKEENVIAEELEEELKLIKHICEIAETFAPEYDVVAICKAL